MKLRHFVSLGVSACAALALPANATDALPPLSPTLTAAPFTVPGAMQYDFTAQTNQQPYRVMVWAPADAKTKPYPVLYILDGNTWFAGAAIEGWHFNNAIMVGVGVPSDKVEEWRRRRGIDLNPGNGGVAFAKVLVDEIKPFIESLYKVEPGRRALYGMSLGGLMTTHVMFNHTQAFDTYVICSPILSSGGNAVLKAEPVFNERARAGEFKLRVLVTAAADENKAVIDGAAAFAERLQQLPKSAVDAHYALFANETHGSVSLATTGRALTFALTKPDAAAKP
jgi:predicted alpha/beta superfamily hydrolase